MEAVIAPTRTQSEEKLDEDQKKRLKGLVADVLYKDEDYVCVNKVSLLQPKPKLKLKPKTTSTSTQLHFHSHCHVPLLLLP